VNIVTLQIVPDRPGFHTSNSIFPVGYCSTRVYASLHSPEKQCLYTCKISDGGNGPMVRLYGRFKKVTSVEVYVCYIHI